MAEKVTLRLEQFDSVNDSDITISGPVNIFQNVDTIQDLNNLENVNDNSVVYVKRVTGDSASQKYRGAYFSYRELTDSWQEILLGTHSHDNKEFLDRLGGVDFGEWIDLTLNTNVFIQSIKPTLELTDKALFFDINNETLEVYNLSSQAWTSLSSKLTITENYFPSVPKIGDYIYYKDTWSSVNTERLYIFFPIQKNEKKIFTLEVIDTDNTDATYEYNLNWQDLPSFDIPTVPENEDGLYLSYDSEKKLEWKNNFIAAQTFQLKDTKVENTGLTVSFDNVHYDSQLDEALVLVGKFFVYNREIHYSSTTKVLTVTLTSDPDTDDEVAEFEAGETVSILIIRNGAASILDSLAKDYLTKTEAITMLTGGAVNLKDYLKKEDGLKLAKKYHTHSQFSRIGHDHDDKYAMFQHTHSEYLSRRAAIALIEEQLNLNEDILPALLALSDSIENNEDLQNFIANVTAIQDIQAEIDTINQKLEDYYTKEQMNSILNNKKFRSDQINVIMDTGNTEFDNLFKTIDGQPKDLTQIIEELRKDFDTDYGNFGADEVLIKENIPVLLNDITVGGFETGNNILAGTNFQQLITRLVQKEIIPEYENGLLNVEFEYQLYPEIGEDVDLNITTNYIRNNSGLLTKYEIISTIDNVNSILHSSAAIVSSLTKTITVLEQPTLISVKGSYSDGLPLYNNIDTFYERFETENEVPGKILAGDTNIIYLTITGRKAIFYGSDSESYEINSSYIRSLEKKILESYNSFEINYEVPVGSKYIYFALPLTEGVLSKILYKEQGNINIIDDFTQQEIIVDSSGGHSSYLYKVYRLEFLLPTISEINITFKK